MKFFNPRLREGGDYNSLSIRQKPNIFNPRLREGGDNKVRILSYRKTFSIHASAKEATGDSKKIS